jgi:Bacteriophage T4-like portal protein (Gp20)
LILKGIIAPEDWTFVRSKLKVQYQKDNFFAELKESEIMQGRIGLAEAMQPFVGSIFSQNYIKRNVFRLSDEEVDSMDEEIAEEQQQGVYDDPNAGSTDSEQPQASQKSPNRRSAPKGE